jgi:hypothetical protein
LCRRLQASTHIPRRPGCFLLDRLEIGRLVAIFALLVAAATLVLAIAVAVNQFPRGLVLLGCVLIAGVSAWYGLRRRGIARVVGVIVAGIALVGAVA